MTLKKETAAKIIDLINSGKTLTVKELDDGSAEVTWDITDEDVAELVELEYPGCTDVEEKFEELFRGVINEAIKKASADLGTGSGE